MTIIKSKPNFLLLLVLVSCFATVHADTGNRSLFAKYSGFAAVNHSQDVVNLSGNEQAPWRARYGPGFGEAVLAILGGVVGNFVGICAGVYIANLGSGDGGFADPIMGGLAGSVCGSTLGVYLAGSAGGCKGKFGSALLGSLLG
ncbi:MAG: hypothetical protein IH584_08120, partial [Candidatus Aminicenantes bacterium]|nr:hypothetical protein [Candidatus Aminicenantes bacterium]